MVSWQCKTSSTPSKVLVLQLPHKVLHQTQAGISQELHLPTLGQLETNSFQLEVRVLIVLHSFIELQRK